MGIFWFILAGVVIAAGIIGFANYETYVKPYLQFFVCCIPATIIATMFVFFGIAARATKVAKARYYPPQATVSIGQQRERAVSGEPPRAPQATEVTPIDKHKKPVISAPEPSVGKVVSKRRSVAELLAEKKRITKFLKDLDEQYKSGLLFPEPYQELKLRHERELNEITAELKKYKQRY
jgi:hypothetical protein